ncbi:MAG TPA: L-rhamnose/proton symporter RhaT [Terriglobales bacterium]|nr:L-rhamnose/proton symporter RhaT [Terriglobales bacterium]
MDQSGLGFFLLFVAGAMNGSFTLPMKVTRNWAWENTWLAWTIFALAIFPVSLTLLTVPALDQVYAQTGAGPALLAAMFGAGWGISQVFLGLAVHGIGMALSFSVILGISAAVGSIVPLVRLHPDAVLQKGGITVLCGVALVLVGVGIAAVAGRQRETRLSGDWIPAGSEHKVSMAKGLLFATISGLGSALVNFGFAFGEPLKNAAQHFGAAQIWSPNAVWLPLMVAGGIPNLIYCIYLMGKNKTGSKFHTPGTGFYWGLAAIMAFFWFGSTVMYGVGATKLGELGPVLGWPLFMSLIVITATFWGIATGEWKGSGKQPLRLMGMGVTVLVVAIFVLGLSSRMF